MLSRSGGRLIVMYKIIFVCLGNICRSPMAEILMRDLIEKKGLSAFVSVSSAATSREENGNPVYPEAARTLAAHGLSSKGKYSVLLTKQDLEESDLIVVMDGGNKRSVERMAERYFGSDAGHCTQKIRSMKSFCGKDGDVADPWYTGDFDSAWQDISEGCNAICRYLQEKFNEV